jgi:hypothetical protein
MKQLAFGWRWIAGAVLGFALVSGCSTGKAARKGQIMLALQTDMSIPDDVTHVRIIVFKNGALKFDQKYRVGPNGEEIPATLGIIASDNASDTTEVRVLSYQGATVRTLNRAVTTIPQDRIATLRVPIQWLCDGQVKPTEGVSDSFDSSCKNPDEACLAGECRKVQVDSSSLPEFRSRDITGGAEDPTRGLCFDTLPCLEPGRDLVPDAQCTISVPEAELGSLNVGLRLAPGRAGICAQNGGCYIPLDRGDAGWQLVPGSQNPTRIQLPPAVCDKLASGDAQAVRVSSVCITKTEQSPTCGPWTSVGTQSPDKGPTGKPPDGTGMMPDPNSACPELYNTASQPVSSDPHVDHFGRLAVELTQSANRIRSDVGMGCAGINQRLTGKVTMFAGAAPSEAELESACADALLALTSKQAQTEASVSPGYCRVDATEQLALEQGCASIAGCSFGTFSERCSSLSTSCSGTCTGACMPGATMLNVACEGSCLGQCDGTCGGTCTGPGGNFLPSSDCRGQCDGSCSGTCQGNCMGAASCSGTCRGTCEGAVNAEFCESPLALPACAKTGSCENLAAATGGMHQQCVPASVFVSGPTPPEVAPAISDNMPRLLQAIALGRGFERASDYLDGAGQSLLPEVIALDSRCFNEARQLIAPASKSIGTAIRLAQTLVDTLKPPGPLGACSQSSADDSCAMCMKTACCAELEACGASANCQQETKCMMDCNARGEQPAICVQQCAVTAGVLESGSAAWLACQSGTCMQCNMPGNVCQVTDALGAMIDDFDDGDLMTSLGNWHINSPSGFLGSFTNVRPGAGSSPAALGIAGSPDPGISIDFGVCTDAAVTAGIAFDGSAQSAGADVALTVRVRTRSTEPSALGGNCSTDCGDHFKTTLSLKPGGFSLYSLPWSNLLNSRAQMPDTRQLVGLDFMTFGGAADQFAIDNVRFLPAP